MRDDRAETAETEPMQALLHRFEIPLVQYAARILGDHDRARDVVQETFVQFAKNGAGLRDDAPAKWLFTVCRNRALNVCRKEKRMTYLDDELLQKQPSDDAAPFEHVEQTEARGFLLRILATLPPRQQEVLQLKFQNDLSYAEIAEVTQLSVSNVGVMIHNALKTLRLRYAATAADFIQLQTRTT
jgi:RNA polymerase sigma-70 factor (ECF subfamily)